MTCSATYTTDAADLAAGFVTNTVIVDSDETSPVTDAATVASDQSASMTIEKSASPNAFTHENQIVYYSFLVTNTGNTALSSIVVSDDIVTSVSCPANSLAVGASMTCTASYPISAADMAADLVTNTVTADSAETTPISDILTISQIPVNSNTDTETVNYAAIAIDKLVSDDNSTWVNSVTVTTGDTVYFQVTVTNPGVVDLTNIVVNDDQCSLSGPSGDTNSDSILQPSETWVYTCSLTAVDGGPYTKHRLR